MDNIIGKDLLKEKAPTLTDVVWSKATPENVIKVSLEDFLDMCRGRKVFACEYATTPVVTGINVLHALIPNVLFQPGVPSVYTTTSVELFAGVDGVMISTVLDDNDAWDTLQDKYDVCLRAIKDANREWVTHFVEEVCRRKKAGLSLYKRRYDEINIPELGSFSSRERAQFWKKVFYPDVRTYARGKISKEDLRQRLYWWVDNYITHAGAFRKG